MIFQKKANSEIELEIKKLQDNIAVVKAAEDILEEYLFSCNPNMKWYVREVEKTIRKMRKAIDE